MLWLQDQHIELADLRQDLVDEWIADGGRQRRRVRLFLAWLRRANVTGALNVEWDDRLPTRPAIVDEQRFAILRRLLHDPELDPRDRFAGSVLLLYGKPTTRIAAVRTTDIHTTADGVIMLRLGRGEIPLPEPLAQVAQALRDQQLQRPGRGWLIPGRHAGQHISADTLQQRLKRYGIDRSREGRHAALLALAARLPAPILAERIGIHQSRAAAWVQKGRVDLRRLRLAAHAHVSRSVTHEQPSRVQARAATCRRDSSATRNASNYLDVFSGAVTSAMANRQLLPPSFLQLAGHPVRWRLLSELAHSDRRVGELCSLLDRRQSLVSYHLGRLRSERVVFSRRSSADGRDFYYMLDLARCSEMLAGTGAALHPGLRLALPPARFGERRVRGRRPRVLFLCTGNSARSQIAEALVEQLTGGAIDASSAGSHPKPLHPNAVRVMRERGIDIEACRSKRLDEFAGERFDYVVSLCDRVREVCPEFPAHPDVIHWSVPDPAREGNSDEETYPAFQRTAAELAARMPFLLELIEHTQPVQEAEQ